MWRSASQPSQPVAGLPQNPLATLAAVLHSTTPPAGATGASPRPEHLDRLRAARLYVCTDARSAAGDLEDFLHAAYAGGVDIIQLRDKAIDTDAELEALAMLARVAREHGALFAVNDRADLAGLVGADVFHIGQHDMSPQQARSLLGPDVLIGRSTHSPEQARVALQDPEVDYFCVGPVWETPTKPGRPAVGLTTVSQAAALAGVEDKPWFAIGGVNESRLSSVLDAGAERIVVVRAVTQADDVRGAAARLRAALPA